MTTIAANRRCMAADRYITDDCGPSTERKIVRIGDAIVGAAGTTSACEKALRYLADLPGIAADENPIPPTFAKDDDLVVLILTPVGLFLIRDTGLQIEELADPHFAIGSGGKAARAGMVLGMEPWDAVDLACQVDCYSDLPIDVMGFGDPPKVCGAES